MTDATPVLGLRGASSLITPRQLDDLRQRAADDPARTVRILDVRWRLDLPEGRPAYVRAHLPGAVYVDLEQELARRGQPHEGRHPLPDVADLERAVRSWGVRESDTVIAYDDNHGVAAARAWWVLRRVGIEVRVLDGGIRAWAAAGLPLEDGDIRPAPGDARIRAVSAGVLTRDEVERFPARGVLLDVRTPEQYSGATTSVDPVGGHIPGAVNLPAMATTVGDGRLLPRETLRRIFATAGIGSGTQVAVYCGSGIASMHTALALAEIGVDALVYPGSWSEWANTRGRPIALGILPSGRLARV